MPAVECALATAATIAGVKPPSLDDLRRYAVARTLFAPTTLRRAIDRLGFVQADPIRAPARAQDLTLRHRVRDYRAGDLERRYPRLAIEEDFFVNYGFLPRAAPGADAPAHARAASGTRDGARAQAEAVLAFVRERGAVHPREVDARFRARPASRNWFGGSSNASTHLLDGMHYRGLLRVARRDGGTRVYERAAQPSPADDSPDARARRDALVDLVVAQVRAAAGAQPVASGLACSATERRSCAQETRPRCASCASSWPQAHVDGIDWYWPAGENPRSRRHAPDDAVRLLAPFDPVVWDRRRFELFWGWTYRFEAYTPAPKRKLGYYALPLLWRERVIGWGNYRNGEARPLLGYLDGRPPRERAFREALDSELAAMRRFLSVE